MKSRNHFRYFSGIAQAAIMLVMGLGACTLAPSARALTVAPIGVSPAVAAPGVPRTITINYFAGCNQGADVVGQPNARTRTVSVRLNLSNAIQCDALVQQTTSVQVTPDTEGDLRVLVMTSLGSFYAEGTIRTRAPLGNRSQIDLSGMWYDPATLGSGLTFMHASTGSDQVFGTWYVYDNQGNPRWFTIQGVQWTAGGSEALGRLYETGASSVVCLPPLTGCPVAAATVGQSGVVRIQIDGPNSARITAIMRSNSANASSSLTVGVTITSNLIRSVF